MSGRDTFTVARAAFPFFLLLHRRRLHHHGISADRAGAAAATRFRRLSRLARHLPFLLGSRQRLVGSGRRKRHMKNPALLLLAALAAGALAAQPAAAQTKWNLPAAYPADNPHTENLAPVRQGCRGRDRRQAADHRASGGLAVQGAGDQARGADRPGADRRGADLDPRERRPDLRHRRRAVPGDQLPGSEEALGGVEAADREEARRARA